MLDVNKDPSICYFITELSSLLEKETFFYCFYDFPRVEIRQKNSLYEILEQIKKSGFMQQPQYETFLRRNQ